MTSPLWLKIRKVGGFVLTFGVLTGLFYLVFFSSFFEITKVTPEKNGNAVSGTQLAPFLEKFKGKNLLFLRTDALTKELEQTFRNEILFVQIKKSYRNRLIVKVDEYRAVINLRVLAGDTIQKFVLNQIGYAIFENTELKELPLLILKTDKTLPKKSILIPQEKLIPMVAAITKFQELFGMKIIETEWKKTERELHLKTEKNFYVWLDLTAGPEQQLNKLKRALPKLAISQDALEYIDLRIAGADYEKVIFKRRK